MSYISNDARRKERECVNYVMHYPKHKNGVFVKFDSGSLMKLVLNSLAITKMEITKKLSMNKNGSHIWI